MFRSNVGCIERSICSPAASKPPPRRRHCISSLTSLVRLRALARIPLHCPMARSTERRALPGADICAGAAERHGLVDSSLRGHPVFDPEAVTRSATPSSAFLPFVHREGQPRAVDTTPFRTVAIGNPVIVVSVAFLSECPADTREHKVPGAVALLTSSDHRGGEVHHRRRRIERTPMRAHDRLRDAHLIAELATIDRLQVAHHNPDRRVRSRFRRCHAGPGRRPHRSRETSERDHARATAARRRRRPSSRRR